MTNHKQRIFIAGHKGMVGSAIKKALIQKGTHKENIIIKTRTELDLTNQDDVMHFFKAEQPNQVYLAAAKVGGIYANNTFPAEFIRENLVIQTNIIHAAFESGVKKLLFLGSSCIYPRSAKNPIKEDALLTSPLESTNEPYAIAKIAGIKMCESYNRQYGDSHGIDYRSVMPTNLYGPGDNYHPQNSHVIPALIQRFHQAKSNASQTISVWGSGKPMREFLYVDDLAKACIHIMNIDKLAYSSHTTPMLSHINIGFGEDVSIEKLAKLIASTVGYQGDIIFDTSKPDGTPKKLMDSGRANNLGWKPSISLEEGLKRTYSDYLSFDNRYSDSNPTVESL